MKEETRGSERRGEGARGGKRKREERNVRNDRNDRNDRNERGDRIEEERKELRKKVALLRTSGGKGRSAGEVERGMGMEVWGVGGACHVHPLCPGVEASEVGRGEACFEGVCPGIAGTGG